MPDEEIRKLTEEEVGMAQDVAMLGTIHLRIEQLMTERNAVSAEIEKAVAEAKKLSSKIIKELAKSKS